MDKYSEKMIKKAAKKIGERRDKQFLKEIEFADKNEMFSVKDGEAEAFVQKNFSKCRRKPSKTFLRVASVFLAVVVGFTVVTLSVDSIKEKVNCLVINFSNPDHAIITMAQNEDEAKILSFKGSYVPTFIPAGYHVEDVRNTECASILEFRDAEDNMIVFEEQSFDLKTSIDTDNAELVETIEINGMKGLRVVHEKSETIMLTAENSMLLFCSSDPDFDLLTFCDKVEKR